MIETTTCEVEKSKIFTVSKGTPRKHNCDCKGALRLSKAVQEKIKWGRLQMSSPS